MAVKKTYRINLKNYGSPPAVMVSQYDEGYAIAFEIFDGPLPVLASSLSGYTFKLKGRQPGNPPFLAYEFEGTLATALNAVVSFEIDTTMTGRAGKGTAELVILDEENDVKFASVNFAVYTEPAAVPDGSIDADVQRAMEIAEEVQEIVDTAAAEVKGEAEAWAVGQRDGEDVPSTDPTYENNAKYCSEVAQDIADSIGIDATLSISGKAADAKKTGDEISALKEDLNATIGMYKKKFDWAKLATSSYLTGWRQGLYGRTAGGINNTSATGVRSVSTNAHYLSECNAFTIYPPNGCTVWVCEYDNLGTFNESHFVKTWDGVSTDNPLTVVVTEGHGYGITIRSDSDAISPTAEFVAQIVMHQYLPLIDEIGSVKAEVGGIKANLQKVTDGDYSATKIDNGVWAVGAVTSSGLQPSTTKEAHSGLFEIGDYDYIDVKLTDQTCKFIVYRYDGTNYSVTPEVKNIWITRGGIRLFDKQYKYIIRASSIPYEVVTDPSVYKESVQVYGGKNKNLCYVEDLNTVVNDGIFEINPKVPLAPMGVTSSGYDSTLYNVCSVPIEIGDYNSILFDAIDTGNATGDAHYAVYTYDGTTYRNVSGGWTKKSLEFTNKSVRYILRVALIRISGTLTDEQFSKACNAVRICRCINNKKAVGGYGYERQYTDITSSLTFEQKAISTTGIEDSTVSLLAKLPNNGNIECRLNRPAGKFSVWKSSGSGFTCLTNGWTYYQYRYTGDYSSDYYVAVATPEDATITLSYFNVVGVYKFLDVGVKYHEGASLSGKNIAVFGDSIVQGRMIKNGSSVNCTMPKPYSNLLAEVAGTEPYNFGIGGATVYDNNWKALARNYVYVTGFDIVFVCAGTNDFGSSIPLEDFRSAYETVIDGLIETNTEVVICTPTRRGTNSTIGGNTLQDFVDIELAVAQERELFVIDLYTLTNNAQFKSHLLDNLHPTEIGARMIADLILNNY